MALRILLGDGQPILRQGVKALLEQEGFEVVGEAGDGHAAVRLARELRPDVAILDDALPLRDGLDTARGIAPESRRTRTIVLTLRTDLRHILEAFRARIKGYVLKTQAAADLIRAIHEVSRGAVYMSPEVSKVVVDVSLSRKDLPQDPLSPREREVLQLIAEGKTTKEIATLLGTTFKTAESHRFRLMRKLEIHQTAGLVRYAIRQGLIQP